MKTEVRVQPTPQDVRAAIGYAAGRKKWLGAIQIALMFAGAVGIGVVVGGGPGALVGYAVALIVLIGAIARSRRKVSRPATLTRMDSTITVDDSGVVVERPDTRIEMSWDVFDHARVTNERLFIRLESGGVICIPRRCFATPEVESSFVDTVATHLRVKGKGARDLTPLE